MYKLTYKSKRFTLNKIKGICPKLGEGWILMTVYGAGIEKNPLEVSRYSPYLHFVPCLVEKVHRFILWYVHNGALTPGIWHERLMLYILSLFDKPYVSELDLCRWCLFQSNKRSILRNNTFESIGLEIVTELNQTDKFHGNSGLS